VAQARGEVDFVGGIKPPAGLIVHHPIWERAYEALRSQILSGQLAPGTRLNLRDVAEQLGISVTPARDAALRLAAEGLVEGRDSSGAE
jgi:DNA-binding GntR family transcriptional regulator